MVVDGSPVGPGQLGTPGMALRDDPRADPRMIAAMEPFGLDIRLEDAPVDSQSPIDALLEHMDAMEQGYEAVFAALVAGLPEVAGVERIVEIIKGVDGNDITLYLHRPTAAGGAQPGILHLHGGGMVLLEAAGTAYIRFRDELAAAGLIVVGVEFRNAGGKHGPYPFPAGLNDCTSALQWVIDNRAQRGISKLVVAGESGGGNLALATTIKAKRDGLVSHIDGVYAMCPYISNAWVTPPPELPSLVENDGYLLSCHTMGGTARVYDPAGEHATDPLAWPYHATTDDVAGLPPHVISLNELDPLRDEGLAYYRKLLAAGVSAVSRTVNGTCHAGDLLFPAAMPDVYMATVRDVAAFASSL